MRLIMTLVVRDERDIIEANLRYHFAQGVDSVIVTDNGSTDGTLDVLGQYAAAGLLHLIEQHSDDYHERQADWITHMARLAATEFDADWVINNDADEFWWPVSGTLRDAFDNIPERYQALAATRPEFIPRPDGPGTFADRMVIREPFSHYAQARPSGHPGRQRLHRQSSPDARTGWARERRHRSPGSSSGATARWSRARGPRPARAGTRMADSHPALPIAQLRPVRGSREADRAPRTSRPRRSPAAIA